MITAAPQAEAVPVIDAHHHLWRYSKDDYGWISDDMPVLRQDFTAELLAEELAPHTVNGSVVVQARHSLDETLNLLDEAARSPLIRGVVGWADIASSALTEQLAQLQTYPLLRGLRHQIQDEASPPEWMADTAVNRGIRQVQQHGLVYDILVTHRHLDEAAKFAARHDGQTLVLDHFGKPDIRAGAQQWAKQIAPLAAMPHVVCKLSGLITEAPAGETNDEVMRPYFDAALEAFGPERLMFGSDWPVCLLAGRYDDVWQLCQRATASLSAHQRSAIMGGNACRIYGLNGGS